MEDKVIMLKEINGQSCMGVNDSITLLSRMITGIIDQVELFDEEYGPGKEMGVIFNNLNEPTSVIVRMVIDMEGDV